MPLLALTIGAAMSACRPCVILATDSVLVGVVVNMITETRAPRVCSVFSAFWIVSGCTSSSSGVEVDTITSIGA